MINQSLVNTKGRRIGRHWIKTIVFIFPSKMLINKSVYFPHPFFKTPLILIAHRIVTQIKKTAYFPAWIVQQYYYSSLLRR